VTARFSKNRSSDYVLQTANEYDDALSFYDSKITDLLKSVIWASELPVLCIVTSDHGERVGEGGLFGHSVVDHHTAKVPLMVFATSPSLLRRFTHGEPLPINHYLLSSAINHLLGFEVRNRNSDGDLFFISSGDVQFPSAPLQYRASTAPIK
jgi:membrane-anchored protein YejM (alkaline phosphatase superfamily)